MTIARRISQRNKKPKEVKPEVKDGTLRVFNRFGTDVTAVKKDGKYYRIKDDGTVAKSPMGALIARNLENAGKNAKTPRALLYASNQMVAKKKAKDTPKELGVAQVSNEVFKNKDIVKANIEKKDNKTKSSKNQPEWMKYSSISAAKKAGSAYYSKDGTKMAAVFAEDLKDVKGSTPKEKLRNYLNRVTGKKRKLSKGGDLKPVPAGNKGLSKLPTGVRNNMGFMYGGGMPMSSKKPRMSDTDYRKAKNGMLVISIDMIKKKKKGKGTKAKNA